MLEAASFHERTYVAKQQPRDEAKRNRGGALTASMIAKRNRGGALTTTNGVRLVACQMSMDVMGIKQEELIDGVELGGVATFIGSGETSDISLFI